MTTRIPELPTPEEYRRAWMAMTQAEFRRMFADRPREEPEPAGILDAPPLAPDPLLLHDPGIW